MAGATTTRGVPVHDARGNTYTDELADRICQLLASGVSLGRICKMDGMPARSTILGWVFVREDFREKYWLARKIQSEGLADEIIEIADDGRNDFMEVEGRNGQTKVLADHEHINRSKLRMDARRFLLAKLQPERYGERLDVNHTGGVSAQLIIKGRDAPDDSEAGSGSAG